MEGVDEKQPAQPVVRDYGDKVVDRSDQRAGGNCRVNMDPFEEKRDHGTYRA